MPVIRFPNQGIELEVDKGKRLVDLCEEKRIPISVACRAGACGTCQFQVLENPDGLSPQTVMEKRFFMVQSSAPPGSRLACQCRVVGDVVLAVNSYSIGI